MKIGRIIHQQVVQLRWHFLACLGLIMVLPLEEAVMNWRDGDGFYAGAMVVASVMISPLLSGLIACAGVQADLNDRQNIFWRSKPIRAEVFIILKFLVGLAIALLILGIPIAFGLMGDSLYKRSYDNVAAGKPIFLNILMISMMAYSLCFLCNVLIRKTARAWLIGMALVCFLLLVPFILPLHLKDFASEFLNVISAIYISITLGTFLIAFVLSLIATSHNWHLQTNLKGLLWSGAALIFLLMLLFTHQVANIKVLDEKVIDTASISNFNNRIICGGQYIEVQDGQIQSHEMNFSKVVRENLMAMEPLYKIEEGLRHERFPQMEYLYHKIDNETYAFRLIAYYDYENVAKHRERHYKKVYLQSYRFEGGYHVPVSIIDFSEFITDDYTFHMVMRKVNDKLTVFIKDSYAVVEFSNNGVLQLIDKKVNGLKRNPRYYSTSVPEEFKVRIIPFSEIDLRNRIKLSIDLSCQYYHIYGLRNKEFHTSSIVEEHEGETSFYLLKQSSIQRFDVVKWDDEYIYCEFRDERPFTFLEQMFGQVREYSPYFVKNGKLFAHSRIKLMVFDVSSDSIRKLGHFERISNNFDIHDIEVLDDGNILLSTSKRQRIDNGKSWEWESYLYLLKNPE